MNVVVRRTGWAALVIAGLAVALYFLFPAVPAPPDSLADDSPVADFLRYGDSLRFETDGTIEAALSKNG